MHRFVVLSCWICLLIASSPIALSKEKVTIFSDYGNLPAQFAVDDLSKALFESGYIIESKRDIKTFDGKQSGNIQIVLAMQGGPDVYEIYKRLGGLSVGTLSSQAYAIRKTDVGNPPVYWVFGGDRAGIMYGGLRLAEMVKTGEFEEFNPEQEKPYLERRGIKFNISLDARLPSFSDNGTNADMNRAYVWDIDFWKEYLDDLARYRYNFVSLWNRHPFPALVKLVDYPEVAMDDVYDNNGLVKKMTIDEKIAMWQEVVEYASNRCIDITWVTWNIILDYAKDFGLEESGLDPKTVDYMRKCTSELFRTYPKLAGIGVTAGEKMRELVDDNDKEKWVFDTYGRGMLDIAEEQPGRKFLFFHRYWWTSFSNIIPWFQPLIDHPDIQFDLSYKYSCDHMYSSPEPVFAKNEVLVDLPSGLKCWWHVRNDDIFTFRWGDPDFVRSYVMNFPPADKTAGYYIGSDKYIWGRETASRNPSSPRQLQTKFNWYNFMLWGRLGYNPSTSDELFSKIMEKRFDGADGKSLNEAWKFASKVYPMATSFQWHNWAYMWHVETCSGYSEETGLRGTKRFYDVLSFIDNPTMPGSDLINIHDYSDSVISGKNPKGITPLQHARLMSKYAELALSELGNVKNNGSKELQSLKEDIRAMANAGFYSSHKIEAATYYSLFLRTNKPEFQEMAIQHMLRAWKGWETYISIFRKNYDHGKIAILNRDLNFDELLMDVRNDITLVGGKFTDKIIPIDDSRFKLD